MDSLDRRLSNSAGEDKYRYIYPCGDVADGPLAIAKGSFRIALGYIEAVYYLHE